jgi:hypothetical protein
MLKKTRKNSFPLVVMVLAAFLNDSNSAHSDSLKPELLGEYIELSSFTDPAQPTAEEIQQLIEARDQGIQAARDAGLPLNERTLRRLSNSVIKNQTGVNLGDHKDPSSSPASYENLNLQGGLCVNNYRMCVSAGGSYENNDGTKLSARADIGAPTLVLNLNGEAFPVELVRHELENGEFEVRLVSLKSQAQIALGFMNEDYPSHLALDPSILAEYGFDLDQFSGIVRLDTGIMAGIAKDMDGATWIFGPKAGVALHAAYHINSRSEIRAGLEAHAFYSLNSSVRSGFHQIGGTVGYYQEPTILPGERVGVALEVQSTRLDVLKGDENLAPGRLTYGGVNASIQF